MECCLLGIDIHVSLGGIEQVLFELEAATNFAEGFRHLNFQ